MFRASPISCIKVHSLNPWLHGHEVENQILAFVHFSRLGFLKVHHSRQGRICWCFYYCQNFFCLENKEKGIGNYIPTEFENNIYQWWESAGCFQPDAKQTKEESDASGRKPYVLPMPPPNVTGRLHLGHAIFVALQDVLASFHRMRGRPVLWLPGAYLFVFK